MGAATTSHSRWIDALACDSEGVAVPLINGSGESYIREQRVYPMDGEQRVLRGVMGLGRLFDERNQGELDGVNVGSLREPTAHHRSHPRHHQGAHGRRHRPLRILDSPGPAHTQRLADL
jgi:hypothetical protein